MTPRRGRRIGRTLLNARQADARRRAIAKLDELSAAAEQPPPWSQPDHDVLADLRGAIEVGRLELPGHHLQRAAAENA